MKREIFAELIKDFYEGGLPDLVRRNLDISLPAAKKAITIIGPRRAGKTYFLYDLMRRFTDIKQDEMIYINLEDDRLLPLNLSDLDLFLQTYYEMYPKNQRRTVYLFLDEIQNVPGWENFVRRILDTKNIIPFITGSSSKLLAKEIATSMRGRSISHLILPFSFEEYLRSSDVTVEKYLSSARKSIIKNKLMNYIEYGGFPEVILEEDERLKIKILKEYVEVILIRDIIERHNVRNTKILRILFNALVSTYSKQFSAHKFYNSLRSQGIKISKNTIYEYLGYLEDSFFIFPVRKFDFSLRNIEHSLPKIYIVDNGYPSKLGLRSSPDTGRLMENTVGIELFRRMSNDPLLKLDYWRDIRGMEVDFVVRERTEVKELIQVCYDIDDYDTKTREVHALMKASDELDCDTLKIITWEGKEDENIDGKVINFISLWEWLLDPYRLQ